MIVYNNSLIYTGIQCCRYRPAYNFLDC
uniref:Uncharacterized protein n=1 Tax=Rhizophora mucronata TaxID=61149 RepID=A0A2P2NBV0_RHIMU